jgi:hypothetical protein
MGTLGLEVFVEGSGDELLHGALRHAGAVRDPGRLAQLARELGVAACVHCQGEWGRVSYTVMAVSGIA